VSATRNIRVLALDVDGTLAAREDEITPRTRDALHRAAACGIEVVIATGRRYRSTQRVIHALGMPVRAAVLGGALVKEGDGTTLHAASFASDDFELVRALIVATGHSLVCQRDSATTGGPDFVVDTSREWNVSTTTYFERQGSFGARRQLAETDCRDAIAIGVFGKEHEVRELQDRVAHAHDDRFLTSIVPVKRDEDWYFELLPSGVSKWSALCALAEREGIEPDEICAVGDEMNDLSMIRGAGIGVAMGNAHPDAVAAADEVTAPNTDDGLARVLERWWL
jgi:Cof subfamily protein (haloacid dehalogenase superfamily)